ncbi:dihydrofolate reductase family protein [Sedimentibacter sp. MB31-C6]|uniref:dihydrofolate reductase family protein n=1 Tax=Sedimentibacter sp. MB31-C6 TaxID=3109366 RepID=UPI002DDD9B1D|nr:dihydrofolate reductase family protein [Sedimentibacter sp. MB36-C1]WSI04586.1 dihydrofolate reductase family protein [Sedimentibacter sp. MB36-C1]
MSRRIVLDLAVSLDGFIEGINGETDWCIMDEEMNFTKFLSSVDAILYGRKSYDLWGTYIPGKESSAMEREIWELVHSKKKYVFSKTLTKIDNNVMIINDNIAEEVNKLKEEPGRDIWLYGGASLIKTFMNLRLVDEYRLSVHPVILGAGKPLFVDIKQRQELKLVDTRRFSSGVVQLCYQHIKK